MEYYSNNLGMKKISLRYSILIAAILGMAMMRLIPHYPNFTPIGAMALFGGAYFSKRWQAFLIPLGALFISDIAINFIIYQKFVLFHSMWLWVYGSFALIVGLGAYILKNVNSKNVILATLSASFLFYVTSNFGVWVVDPINMYPNTGMGLLACYSAGLPYLLGTIFGDLFYSAVFFTAFELVQSRFLVLKPIKT